MSLQNLSGIIMLLCLPVWIGCTALMLARARRYARLNLLLSELCVRAFVLHNAPIWQAWTDTIGDIDVSVATRLKGPPR
jgi:hypothetical protein